MTLVTLSNDFKIRLPKKTCEEMGLEAGQQFSVISKGGVIELIPMRTIQLVRGLLKETNPNNYRDH